MPWAGTTPLPVPATPAQSAPAAPFLLLGRICAWPVSTTSSVQGGKLCPNSARTASSFRRSELEGTPPTWAAAEGKLWRGWCGVGSGHGGAGAWEDASPATLAARRSRPAGSVPSVGSAMGVHTLHGHQACNLDDVLRY